MSWIWLNKNIYPNNQETKCSSFSSKPINYCVASFWKNVSFQKNIKKIVIKFACDTLGYLLIDDKVVINDNAKAASDFTIVDIPSYKFFYLTKTIEFNQPKRDFSIKSYVQLGCTNMYDFSSGFGGLNVDIEITFLDNSKLNVETDDTWNSRLEKAFYQKGCVDFSLDAESVSAASLTNDKKELVDAQIKPLVENEITFDNKFVVNGNSSKTFQCNFDHCYSSHLELEIVCNGIVSGELITFEAKDLISGEHKFKTNQSIKFRYFDLVSVGGFKLKLKNKSAKEAKIVVHILHSHYQLPKENEISIEDKKLSDLFNKCTFAVKNCSQSLYLDSPKHCEPLASCSGDYNIESLVNAFYSGDYELTKHCLRGYAYHLERNGGRCANTSYGLVFVKWLKNIYMLTGDKELLKDCEKGMKATIDMYLKTLGNSGLVEKCYNYVFIDWLVVDGYNLFSPPKSLGQSVVSLFLFDALKCASLIYEEIGNISLSKKMAKAMKRLKKSILSNLFDADRCLFTEGMNTPNEKFEFEKDKPENNGKTYFRKHANILAVSTGLVNKSKGRKIINKLFKDDLVKDLPVQPYFLHYFFEAIHEVDLDKRYFKKILKLFTQNIKIKDKGLPEGFYKPSPDYSFDYSHAWACTPYYSFIVATSGLRILEPGMTKIFIKPMKFGKNYNYVIPTPYGDIKVKESNGVTNIECPKGIEAVKE